LLNSEESVLMAIQAMFKFKLGWLLRDGFMKLVREIWTNTLVGSTPKERWQGKIRRLCQYLRGWAKNTSGQYKKEKKKILDTLDGLDKKAEHTLLQRRK
jgi:hypothetical protein